MSGWPSRCSPSPVRVRTKTRPRCSRVHIVDCGVWTSMLGCWCAKTEFCAAFNARCHRRRQRSTRRALVCVLLCRTTNCAAVYLDVSELLQNLANQVGVTGDRRTHQQPAITIVHTFLDDSNNELFLPFHSKRRFYLLGNILQSRACTALSTSEMTNVT
jgi:hypothetical protein